MGNRNKRLLAIAISAATVVASGQYMERTHSNFTPSKPGPQRAAMSVTSATPAAETVSFTVSGVVPLAARGEMVRGQTPHREPALPRDPAARAVVKPVPVQVASLAGDIATDALSRGPVYGASGLPCGPRMTADPIEGGMVRLGVSAPCRPGARITLHHDLLSFSLRTDHMGLMSVDVPAMAVSAAFIAEFDDGVTLTRALSVPEAGGFARWALVSHAESGLHLHAFEAGSGFGGTGHVWAAAPRGKGSEGALSMLGDPDLDGARLAEVYSVPADRTLPRLSVEAEVTPGNCGRDIEAETVSPGSGERMEGGRIRFSVPACDAVGEYLVLKNLSQGRKIAVN